MIWRGWLRPLRRRLTLWYAAILAGALLFSSGLLYASVAAGLLRDLDKSLALQAKGLAATIVAFREAEESKEPKTPKNWRSGSLPNLAPLIQGEPLADLIRRWAKRTSLLETSQLIRLIDRWGQVMAESSGFGRFEITITRPHLRSALEGRVLYETVSIDRSRFRVITFPAKEYGRVRYLVRWAAPLDSVDLALSQLRLWMLGLIPLTLLAAVAGGWFLSAQALRAVDRMTDQARGIGAEALDHRIDLPNTGDELDRLAKTFNGMLDRIEQAFRRQRQFSAAASHELRTPLTVMKGELEVALRRPREPEEYRRVLGTHLEAVHELSRVVEELLMLARTTGAQTAIDHRPVDLSELAQTVCAGWEKAARPKEIRLSAEPSEPVWISGEQRLLERLLSNLLDNAIRHTPVGGLVEVRTTQEEGSACWIVRDTGPGIAEGEIETLFERFFVSPSESKGSSTGLGLGLCRWIAEAHGGRIQLSILSRPGACFKVSFPPLPLSSD